MAPAPPPSRRSLIAHALESCIREKGYAECTLTDVAREAGMSPSHVLYYFDNKASILEFLFEEMMTDVLEDVMALVGKPPREQIDAIARLFFGSAKIDRATSGVYFEIFGVAAHNPRMRETKQRWDRAMLVFFVELFQATPGRYGMAVEQAAGAAFAMLIGLRMNSYFDDDRELPAAHEQLRMTMLTLAGLQDEEASLAPRRGQREGRARS